jgi:hypothetical protein
LGRRHQGADDPEKRDEDPNDEHDPVPFRIDMIPRVINRITYRRPKRPIETPETASGIVPSNWRCCG